MKGIKKIAIIGVGLMGGSLALALRKNYPNFKIWGYARKKSSLLRIKKSAVLNRVTMDIRSLIIDADIVVLATRANAFTPVLKDLIRAACIVGR